MIKVLFFASLREQLGCAGLDVPDAEIANVEQLRQALSQKGEAWQQAFASDQLQVAVNQQLSAMDAALTEGDEVAFFPPVTGG